MRIGTIGTGMIVRAILENVAKTEGITCRAVYSRREETGRALADQFGVEKVYTDLDAMCQDPDIDFVYVASPNSLHYEHTKKALSWGKNVLCEKPFVPTLAQARELAALAEEKGLLLIEAITTQYHPNYPWVRQHLADLGELKLVLATFCQYSSRYDLLKAGQLPNIFNPEFAAGSLMDLNLYNIHFIAGLLGSPDRVEYFPGKHENGIDTHGVLILQYGSLICQCTAAKDAWCENSVQILGDRGYLHISPGSGNCRQVRLVRKDQAEQTVSLPEDQWFYEIQTLSTLVNAGEREVFRKNLDTTLTVVDILERARKSAGIRFPEDAQWGI